MTLDACGTSLEFNKTSTSTHKLTLDTVGTSSKLNQTRRIKDANSNLFNLKGKNLKPIGSTLFTFNLAFDHVFPLKNNPRHTDGQPFDCCSLITNKTSPKPTGGKNIGKESNPIGGILQYQLVTSNTVNRLFHSKQVSSSNIILKFGQVPTRRSTFQSNQISASKSTSLSKQPRQPISTRTDKILFPKIKSKK